MKMYLINKTINSKQTYFPLLVIARSSPDLSGYDVAISAYHFKEAFKILHKFRNKPILQLFTNVRKSQKIYQKGSQ